MSFKVELMSYDGREDETMQEEEVEQEDIDPREELEHSMSSKTLGTEENFLKK